MIVIISTVNNDSYSIEFMSRKETGIKRYDSSNFAVPGDVIKAADEVARSYETQGLVVLEKNVRRNSFTISFFDPR